MPLHEVPTRVVGNGRIEVARDDAEIGRHDLPLGRMTIRPAPGPQLLEMGDLTNVDLGGEVPANRVLEALIRREIPTGKGPLAGVRLLRPTPCQHVKTTVADLEDDGGADVVGCGKAALW